MPTDELLPQFQSANLEGGADFVATHETILELMGPHNITTFNLCFTKTRQRMPNFAVSTVPAKVLLSLSAEQDCPVEKLGVVRKHEWTSTDKEVWIDRFCDNNYPVSITFRRNWKNSSHNDIIFSHDNIISLAYTYSTCTRMGNALYFLIFVPQQEVNVGRISFLSNFEYLTSIEKGMKQKLSHKSFVPNECITCYARFAEIVFIPCGHLVFCKNCAGDYRDDACPICKQCFDDKVVSRPAAKFCLTCPAVFDCKEVNAMLLPCCCVVGCMEMTSRSVRSGEECMICDKVVKSVQQIYV